MRVDPLRQESAALAAFNEKAARHHLVGNWVVEPYVSSLVDGPEINCEPHLWHWQTVRDHLMETFDVLPENGGARRNLTFLNPALPRGTTHTLSAGVQLIGPGELAPTHAHSMNALRFVIEGDEDAFTVVDGVRCPMKDYDLIVTPAYTRHDHHNGSDRHVSWLDVLDVALMIRLNQVFFVPGESPAQAVRNVSDGAAGPAWLRRVGAERPVPTLRFPWTETLAQLRAAADAAASPDEEVVFEYVDPASGGPVFATMTCSVRLLRPGQRTPLRRSTASAVFFAIGGEGEARAADTSMRWRRHDCFAVPNWTWHSLENLSAKEDAILFSVSEAAALRALGMYREEVGRAGLSADSFQSKD